MMLVTDREKAQSPPLPPNFVTGFHILPRQKDENVEAKLRSDEKWRYTSVGEIGHFDGFHIRSIIAIGSVVT